MRGNWEGAEAMVLTPNHRLQQQQHTILEEQQRHHHPLHLSTTPAWGIADRTVVKEEPIEDKTSDSGVSPGHYSNSASPRSRRSSSTVNCSLSPVSSASHDSHAMQINGYDYSPQNMFKNCDMPMDFPRVQSVDDMPMHHRQSPHEQGMDTASDGMKSGSDEAEGEQDTFQCPLSYCLFTTLNRIQFSEHLANHYTANEMPDFSKFAPSNNHHQYANPSEMSPADSESNRASPSQGERSDQGENEFDDSEEPGVRVPRVNSQGKVKTFKCKQCNFTSITKLEFWDHTRGHIKHEKLLTCPKCPFVTEYKHHLEYHLRNHFGSKPFKCDKCSYSCVNKSMLNSHLKSHSNVYQYRCANCSYATKYLHSLKLHLRKYNHQPAMVLNADGTPNPLPIVDVYGTRRGPKQKNLTPKLENDVIGVTSDNQIPVSKQQQQPTIASPSQLSPVMNHHQVINPMNMINALANGNGINPIMALQYNQLYNTNFPMGTAFGVNDETTEKQLEQLRQSLCVEYAKAMVTDKINSEFSQDNKPVNMFNFNNNAVKMAEIPATVASVDYKSEFDPMPLTPESSPESKSAPLDLSKPEVVNNNNNSNINNNKIDNSILDSHQDNYQKQMNVTGSPRTSGTSRRKGKAFKLAVREVEEESEEENGSNKHNVPADLRNSNCPTSDQEQDQQKVENEEINKDAIDKNSGVGMSGNEFTCQFCEIAFGNEVMYTVHMGYHGYKNPFTCNMCGHQCDDKVSFFLHIARSKHA